jgi:hypothetical protein
LRPSLLLLHPLYLCPYKVSRCSLYPYRIDVLRVVEFQHVLHLPDTLKRAAQPLCGAKLLLLLWLCAFRHRDLQRTLASCLNYLIITLPLKFRSKHLLMSEPP